MFSGKGRHERDLSECARLHRLYELGWAPEGACSGCLRLAKERAEEVGILQLGVGLFADKAVIKKTNGALATVPMSELTIID